MAGGPIRSTSIATLEAPRAPGLMLLGRRCPLGIAAELGGFERADCNIRRPGPSTKRKDSAPAMIASAATLATLKIAAPIPMSFGRKEMRHIPMPKWSRYIE